eukprot:1123402-Alexandrium_andersonii.AAC.1
MRRTPRHPSANTRSTWTAGREPGTLGKLYSASLLQPHQVAVFGNILPGPPLAHACADTLGRNNCRTALMNGFCMNERPNVLAGRDRADSAGNVGMNALVSKSGAQGTTKEA